MFELCPIAVDCKVFFPRRRVAPAGEVRRQVPETGTVSGSRPLALRMGSGSASTRASARLRLVLDATIRPATRVDVDPVLLLWSLAAENAGRPLDHPSAVERLIAHDDGALLVAVHEGAVVGTVIAGWDGWRAHLYRLAVHPDYRRRGIGRALLAAAVARLRRLGAERLDAMVNDGNDLGQLVWAADGFRRQDDWRRWVKPVADG